MPLFLATRRVPGPAIVLQFIFVHLSLLLLMCFTSSLLGAQGLEQVCSAKGGTCFEGNPLSKVLLQASYVRTQREAVQDSEVHEDFQPVALQRRQDVIPKTYSMTDCPHTQAGLEKFELLDEVRDHKDIVLTDGKYLVSESVSIGKLFIKKGVVFVLDDKPGLMVETTGVVVEGELHVGSRNCPIMSKRVGFTLVGCRADAANFTVEASAKGILVQNHGKLHMYGKQYTPTWTRLRWPRDPNQTLVVVEDPTDWEPDMQVLLVTSTWDDDDSDGTPHQNEVRTIQSINLKSQGKNLRLASAIEYMHWAGPEYQAEVGLLDRNIVLEGDESSEESRYGGHVKCHMHAVCQFSSVKAFRMGQENGFGRYPFHLHMLGDVKGESFVEDCVVHHSYFKAYTIHATSNSRFSRNIAYDISGSAFYMEDGVEEGNLFEFNLVAHVKPIRPFTVNEMNQNGQSSLTIVKEGFRILPTDATPAAFYCTNANNTWIGNAASGGFTGFFFPTLPKALSLSYPTHQDYVPKTRRLNTFDSNTAHSSGWMWNFGACIYVGGEITEDAPGSTDLKYRVGRIQFGGSPFIMNNTKTFLCNAGVRFWGGTSDSPTPYQFWALNYESADNRLGYKALGPSRINNAIYTGGTWNPQKSERKAMVGIEMYDTDTFTMISDIVFRKYHQPNVGIMDLTRSDIMRPQGMFAFKNLHCYDSHLDACFHHDKRQSKSPLTGSSLASQTSNLIDYDGSGARLAVPEGYEGPSIFGADDSASDTNGMANQWWKLEDGCARRWGFYICPTHGTREVVSIWLGKGKKIQQDELNARTMADPIVGKVYHFGHVDRYQGLGKAGSPVLTGVCCDIGWYLHLEGDVPVNFLSIHLDQMVNTGGLIFATPYPLGSTFGINRCGGTCVKMTQASTLDEVRTDPEGNKYFVNDLGVLFLNLVNPNSARVNINDIPLLETGRRYTDRILVKNFNFGQTNRTTVDFQLPGVLQPLMIKN